MMKEIKKTLANIMFTTGAAILVLAVVGTAIGGTTLDLIAIFQTLGVCIVIHLGLLFTRKFESKYYFLEYLLDIGYIMAVLIVSGAVLGWYDFTPIWILAVMAIVIYFFGLFANIVRTNEDVKEINKLLQKRKERKIKTAS
ncbi:MAG: DUF3021 family protein [Treponema sp.]|jgi:hypothetical protein|nr:DUF3021 family protein [Treponema sp.]